MSDYKDYAARRLRPEERRGIMHMDMLSRSFRLAACDLGKRLEGYKYLSRDIGMMQSVCRRLIEHAMENVEPEMRAQVLRQSRDYTLGLERIAAARKEEEVVMPMSDEWQFVSIVLDSRCSMCLKSGAESRQCRVRALLRKYADEPDPGAMGCGYAGCQLSNDASKINRQEKI